MDFSIQLSAYYPDKSYGGDRLYRDMLDQAVLADRTGFDAVSLTEHHLINILMMPAPLQFAVKIADATDRVKIMTSVAVLPLHDMRSYAGEVICADIFTEGRLMLGVGRGAFGFEMERLGVPIETSREKFDESLNVLTALLREEEVSWDGTYYKFDALTVMPRPVTAGGPPIMMAVLVPEAIYHCTRRGFHIQTTPLSGDHQLMLDQVDAFNRGKAELGEAGRHLTLSLSRVAFVARSEADRRSKIEAANGYYSRFDNVYTGPGIVENGMIAPLPRKQTIDELAESLLICTPQEMVDKLGPYADSRDRQGHSQSQFRREPGRDPGVHPVFRGRGHAAFYRRLHPGGGSRMSKAIDCACTVEGAGPPLFLIHGIGAARDTWRFVLPALTDHFTVVSYDLRGHGTSPMPDGEFGLDELVDDLERLRELSGFEQAHFAGHSLGGMIGPAYARKHAGPRPIARSSVDGGGPHRGRQRQGLGRCARHGGEGRRQSARYPDRPLVHRRLHPGSS